MFEVKIEKLIPSAIDAALNVFLGAFNAPKTGAHVETFYDAYKLYPKNWLVAHIGDEIVGTVAAFNHKTLLHIGYVSVAQQYQKRGIGKLLVDSILSHFSTAEVTSLNATDLGVKLYNKMGFKPLAKVYGFSLQKEKFRKKPKNNILISRFEKRMIPEIVRFDQKIFGAERNRAIEFLLGKFSQRVAIARDKTGNFLGYIVCTREHIGPFFALTKDCALALLEKAFEFPFENGPIVITSGINSEAVKFFTEIGSVETQGTKMFLGNGGLLENYKNVWGEISYAMG